MTDSESRDPRRLYTATQTSPSRTSHANRCTDIPRTVVHRPVVELEPPAVERADGLPLLDPAPPQRAAGVRAAAEQGVDLPAVVEERQGHPRHEDRVPLPLGHVLNLADRDELGHPSPASRTKSLGLASEPLYPVQFTVVAVAAT